MKRKIIIRSEEELARFYDEDSATYNFVDADGVLDVKFKDCSFLEPNRNIHAGNISSEYSIMAKNVDVDSVRAFRFIADDIVCGDVNVDTLRARNIESLGNIHASIHARRIIVERDLVAYNIYADSVVVKECGHAFSFGKLFTKSLIYDGYDIKHVEDPVLFIDLGIKNYMPSIHFIKPRMKKLVIYSRRVTERTQYREHRYKEVEQVKMVYGGKEIYSNTDVAVDNPKLRIPFEQTVITKQSELDRYWQRLGGKTGKEVKLALLEYVIPDTALAEGK